MAYIKNRGATLYELRPDSVKNVYLFYLLESKQYCVSIIYNHT